MREQLEPEGLFDDAQNETRPALGDEAKKALELANQRRNNLQPIIDKDAETAAMMPNDYQAALERLKAQRASGAPAPMAPATTRDKPRDERSDPAFAIAQLNAQRQSGASAPPPPSRSVPPPSMNGSAGAQGTGPNRPIALDDAAIPSARDLAARVARRSFADIKPPSSASVPPPPVMTDDPEVIKSLMGGAPLPPPSRPPVDPLAMTGGTMPMQKLSELGLKPATGAMPLAPQRTPAPVAVGGKGGLMIQTDRPGSMPPSGFGAKTQPMAQTAGRPNTPSRPPGAFGPSPSTPPKQYDFKRWSSPEISEMPSDGAPVTFQVYTPQDVAQGRGPMRSLPVIDPQQPPSGGSIAMKVGLAVLGGIIVLVTAAAVIMVSTDEPKKPTAPTTPTITAPPSVLLAPEPLPPPAPIVIPGDPPIDEPAPTPAKKPHKPHAVPAPAPPADPGPGSSKGGAVTPPPNPYGK